MVTVTGEHDSRGPAAAPCAPVFALAGHALLVRALGPGGKALDRGCPASP